MVEPERAANRRMVVEPERASEQSILGMAVSILKVGSDCVHVLASLCPSKKKSVPGPSLTGPTNTGWPRETNHYVSQNPLVV